MPSISDYCFDLALAPIDTQANRLDICSTEPTTYAQATSTLSLGNKTGISVSAPTDRTPNGRKVTVAAITDGTVTANGTPNFWAVTDTVNSRLLATGVLSPTQAVVQNNAFTTPTIDIGIADAITG